MKKIYYIACFLVLCFAGINTSNAQTHFKCVSNTGNSYSIVIQLATIEEAPLSPGNEIAVFTQDSLCVGVAMPDSSTQIAIAAWKDDPQTPQKDGYTAGETMSFKIWDASENLEMIAIATYTSGNGTFGSGAFAIISNLNGMTNFAPEVIFPDSLIFEEDVQAFLGLDTLVNDLNHADSVLSWHVAGNQNIRVTIDMSTRIATLTPRTDWFGIEQIVFTAKDPGGLVGNDTIVVNVLPINDPPSTPQLLAPADRDRVTILKWNRANDPDSGDTVHYRVQIAPDSLFFQNIVSKETENEELAISEVSSQLDSGSVHYWRVQAIDQKNAGSNFSETWSFRYEGSDIITEVVDGLSGLPLQFELHQNYPNPFNPVTTIRFALASSAHVSLKVYNTIGNEVAVLLDGRRKVGVHRLVFNAANLPSGVYFYRLQAKAASGDPANRFAATRRLSLFK